MCIFTTRSVLALQTLNCRDPPCSKRQISRLAPTVSIPVLYSSVSAPVTRRDIPVNIAATRRYRHNDPSTKGNRYRNEKNSISNRYRNGSVCKSGLHHLARARQIAIDPFCPKLPQILSADLSRDGMRTYIETNRSLPHAKHQVAASRTS